MNWIARLRSKYFVYSLGVLAALVLGLLGGAGGFLLYSYWNPPTPAQSDNPGRRLAHASGWGKPASTESDQGKVCAMGKLQPRSEVIDIGGLMGDRLGSLEPKIVEGALVTKGKVLGHLDSYKERAAERAAFKAQLEEARARLKAEEKYYQVQLKEAEIGERQAKQLDPLDIKAQQAKVNALKVARENAKKQVDRLAGISAGSITSLNLDQASEALTRTEAELEAATAVLDKAKEGSTLNGERATAQRELAEAALARVTASSAVGSLEKNLELADQRIERTEIRAPCDGTILKILAHPGEKLDAKPILRMGDTSQMYAVAEVYETDIRRVQVGQLATITSLALPEPALKGKVTRIGRMIFKNDVLHIDPAADADARVVEVWIELNKESSEKAAEWGTNLQVDVEITTK